MFFEDAADLFAQLYDTLPERLFAEDEEAEAWLDDEDVADIAASIETEAVEIGCVSAGLVERFLTVEQVERNTFAILLGLDRAFMQVDLTTATRDSAGVSELAARYLETGRYSTTAVEGAVVPKIVAPAQEHLIPQSMREAFAAVIRVPAGLPVKVDYEVLRVWPTRTEREAGLYVAAMPAFDRNELLLARRIPGPPACYSLRLQTPEDPLAWVHARLEALDATEAFVAVLPELAVTPELVGAWRTACQQTPAVDSRLRAIVIGSGPDCADEQVRPHNRAVVIDRATGEVLWHQDKQFRFQLEQDILDRWNLDELAPGPLEEWIIAGGELTVREAPGLRMTILVCEDLTELQTVGQAVAQLGVSHALCPVFSQAIRRYRWEQNHAGWLSQNAGVQTIVCNSQYIGDVEPDAEDPCGDVLVVSDEIKLAPQSGCVEPILIRLTEHGAYLTEARSRNV